MNDLVVRTVSPRLYKLIQVCENVAMFSMGLAFSLGPPRSSYVSLHVMSASGMICPFHALRLLQVTILVFALCAVCIALDQKCHSHLLQHVSHMSRQYMDALQSYASCYQCWAVFAAVRADRDQKYRSCLLVFVSHMSCLYLLAPRGYASCCQCRAVFAVVCAGLDQKYHLCLLLYVSHMSCQCLHAPKKLRQ